MLLRNSSSTCKCIAGLHKHLYYPQVCQGAESGCCSDCSWCQTRNCSSRQVPGTCEVRLAEPVQAKQPLCNSPTTSQQAASCRLPTLVNPSRQCVSRVATSAASRGDSAKVDSTQAGVYATHFNRTSANGLLWHRRGLQPLFMMSHACMSSTACFERYKLALLFGVISAADMSFTHMHCCCRHISTRCYCPQRPRAD